MEALFQVVVCLDDVVEGEHPVDGGSQRAEAHPWRRGRHSELVDLISGVSRKVLTQTLRRLQRYGLVERRAEAPRRVEYRLTDLGRTPVEPIEVLTDWARDHGGAVADFQEAAASAPERPR